MSNILRFRKATNDLVTAMKQTGWRFNSSYTMLSKGTIVLRVKENGYDPKLPVLKRAFERVGFKLDLVDRNVDGIGGSVLWLKVPSPDGPDYAPNTYLLQYVPVQGNYPNTDDLLIFSCV